VNVALFYQVYTAAGEHPRAEQLQHEYIDAGSDGLHQWPNCERSLVRRFAEALAKHLMSQISIPNNGSEILMLCIARGRRKPDLRNCLVAASKVFSGRDTECGSEAAVEMTLIAKSSAVRDLGNWCAHLQ